MSRSILNKTKQILIIEDDPDIANLLTLHLTDLNYKTEHCANGQIGLDTALCGNFDLIILDLMLPDIDGFEICKKVRAENKYLPILMLTSRSEEIDRVLGLELGADDYLTKPFSIRELVARVNAIFRRIESTVEQSTKTEDKQSFIFDNLKIDFVKRSVCLDNKPIELTVKEYDLLALFSKNPGRTYSRKNLLEIVWGYQFDGYDHTVNSHINRLRAKIEQDPANPKFIQTVWGHGYRFTEIDQ